MGLSTIAEIEGGCGVRGWLERDRRTREEAAATDLVAFLRITIGFAFAFVNIIFENRAWINS